MHWIHCLLHQNQVSIRNTRLSHNLPDELSRTCLSARPCFCFHCVGIVVLWYANHVTWKQSAMISQTGAGGQLWCLPAFGSPFTPCWTWSSAFFDLCWFRLKADGKKVSTEAVFSSLFHWRKEKEIVCMYMCSPSLPFVEYMRL